MNNKIVFTYLVTLIICTIPLPLFVSSIFYMLLILYTIYYSFVNKISPRFSNVTIVFVLFYALMVLSYFWSINKELTLIGIGRKSAFLILPLLFTFIPKFSLEEVKNIFRYFSFAMGFYALFFILIGIWSYITTGNVAKLSHHGLVSSLDLNRIYVSLFTVIALFHLIYNEKRSLITNSLFVLLAVFLILLSSKTIIIATLAVVMFFTIRTKLLNIKLKSIIYAFSLIIGVLFISSKINSQFFSELFPRFNEIKTKNSFGKGYYFNGSELRILYTRFLVELEKEEDVFFTGFGLNATQQKLNEKCIEYDLYEGYGKTYNFHNQYNQSLAEIGIFGLLAILGILYFGFRLGLKNQSKFSIAVLIIFATLMTTESVFNRQQGIYFFLIVYLVLLHLDILSRDETKSLETNTN